MVRSLVLIVNQTSRLFHNRFFLYEQFKQKYLKKTYYIHAMLPYVQIYINTTGNLGKRFNLFLTKIIYIITKGSINSLLQKALKTSTIHRIQAR